MDAGFAQRSLREQEEALLEDLLFALLGVDGSYVRTYYHYYYYYFYYYYYYYFYYYYY